MARVVSFLMLIEAMGSITTATLSSMLGYPNRESGGTAPLARVRGIINGFGAEGASRPESFGPFTELCYNRPLFKRGCVPLRLIGFIWGIAGVIAILALAVRRLAPYVGELSNYALGAGHWLALVAWTLYMLYAEGYKGFHLNF